jgi:pyridoxamine 5'-phosphate oxidase
MSVSDIRRDYAGRELNEADAGTDPLQLFERWFAEAVAAVPLEPNAMTLATVSADGAPSARIVLLKGFDASGFVFFTNYDSAKGRDLAAHPHAALLFYWAALDRQVRITGRVSRVTREESEAYFHSRPIASRISAAASPQSQVVRDREELERRVGELSRDYEGREVPRPEHWGGYRLTPDQIEFWQGRQSRLHDRLRYTRESSGDWTRVRLAP